MKRGRLSYLKLGHYNLYCDRCGKQLKDNQSLLEWTGMIVCGRCVDERHPQEYVRGRIDHMQVPSPRPFPAYNFAGSGDCRITLEAGQAAFVYGAPIALGEA